MVQGKGSGLILKCHQPTNDTKQWAKMQSSREETEPTEMGYFNIEMENGGVNKEPERCHEERIGISLLCVTKKQFLSISKNRIVFKKYC